jgi:hypothetical protein
MLHRMTTLNPRITVTLTPAVAAVLRELSKVSGNSQSAIVGDLLQHSLPVFERMAKVMQTVALAKEKGVQVNEAALGEMRDGLERAQGRIEEELGLFDELVEPVTGLLEDAEKINRRGGRPERVAATAAARAGRTALGSSAPISNRGVTPHPTQKTTGQTRTIHKGGRRGPV